MQSVSEPHLVLAIYLRNTGELSISCKLWQDRVAALDGIFASISQLTLDMELVVDQQKSGVSVVAGGGWGVRLAFWLQFGLSMVARVTKADGSYSL